MSRSTISLILSILLALTAAAGAQPPSDELVPNAEVITSAEGPWVVNIDFDDRATADSLYQRLDVWRIFHDQGYLEAAVSPDEYRELEAEGFRLEIDPAKTRKLSRIGIPLKMQTTGIPGFPCYRTVEETYATAQAIVAAHPDLATWTDIGDSWEKTQDPQAGWDIFVLKLTQSAVPGPKPVFFANFAIHAREYVTAEVGTRFGEMLADGYGVDPDITWLLDHHEVHLILQTNPDGRKQAESGILWRKNTNNTYCSNTNNRGADLNRNFDFEWGCCGGSSSSQCNTVYRGAAPASEPEVQTVQNYVTSIFPDQRGPGMNDPAPADAMGVAIDIHASGQLVLWPWGFDFAPSPNGTAFTTLGRKLAFFNGHTPLQTRNFANVDGDSLDYFYGELGVAGFAYELGTEFFESCSFFETNILQGNLDSLLYGAKVARTPYLTPAGPEALGAVAEALPVAAGGLTQLTATVDDTRFNTLNGTEPTQTIAAAEAFVDVPPWDVGAVPLAMVASDGTFDQGIEAVEAMIDTTGLAPGRHMLFVRGIDSAGNEGVVTAAFLYVVDPAVSPVVQGFARDAITLAPLAGDVTLDNFTIPTDPGTGFYSLQVPAGTYDITARASGYVSQSALGVVANNLATVQQDFNLTAEMPCTVAVDFDDGNAAGWTNNGASTCTTGSFVVATPTQQANGGVITQVGGDHTSGTGNAFFSATNTSVGSNDVDRGVCVVLSPVYPISADSDVSIWYFHGQRDAGDDPGDFFLLEISTDGGAGWSPMASLGDVSINAAWTEATASVSAGSNVQFRVQVADGTGGGDLVEGGVDDLLICPTAPTCVVDADCDDTLFCNGAETCNAGTCQAAAPVACDDGVACTADACNEATDSCDATPDDALCDNGVFCDGAEICDAVLDCQTGSDPCPGEACDEVGGVCTECAVDADCDDSLFCNGAETCNAGFCQAGTSVTCDDGVACTVDACNETTDSCDATPSDALCDNGLFCDGAETCDAVLDCQTGTPVACDDSVACTVDACNETTDSCDNLPDDGVCQNGAFCDGAETCDPVLGCQAGGDPCSGLFCDETGDVCAECLADGDCDDGLFCNGAETCNAGSCQAGSDPCPGQSCDEASDQCIATPQAQLEWGTVTVAGTAVTVNLAQTYFSPVVVTSIRYANNNTPVVSRVSNVTPTSFDVRLQNPSDGAVVADEVSYLVVEEGTWTVDGVAIEAQTYTSTVTDENNSWVAEARSYGQSYTNPVVLGQVMTSNDAGWSVFWNRGGARTNPPSATTLGTGKTVCEDPNTTRVDETVGFVVIETGHATLGGVEFEAALGPDIVGGVVNSSPYTYTFNTAFAATPAVAVVTMAGMDGNNGGWAHTFGASPMTTSTLGLGIDEDQLNDTERNHTTEQVGFVVFATSGVYP